MSPDPYYVLGVAPTATSDEIRAAYHEQARLHHPDAPGGSHDRMQAVNDAWELLSDETRRADHDRDLARQQRERETAHASHVDDDWVPHHEPRVVDADTRGSPVVGVARALITFAPMCFVAGFVLFGLGVVLQVAGIVQAGLAVLLLSIVAFVIAPFLAMGASIQRGTVGSPDEAPPIPEDGEST